MNRIIPNYNCGSELARFATPHRSHAKNSLVVMSAAALMTSFLLTSCTYDEVDAFGHGMDVGYHAGGGSGHVYHEDYDGD